MDTEHVHQAIVRPFVVFCSNAGGFVDLGLSAEKLVCLFNECLQVAKYHHDHNVCILVCRLAAHRNKELGNNDNVLLYANEMLQYARKLALVQRERYEVCTRLIVGETGIALYDQESKIVLLAIAFLLSASIKLKGIEHDANLLITNAYESLEQHEDAIPCIQRMIDIAIEINDNRALVHLYHSLARIYYKLNQYDQVVICAKKCIGLAKEINLNDGLPEAYCLLINSCGILARHDHVIKYAREYFDVAQTIQVHPEGRPEGDSVFVLADLLENPEQYDDAVIDGQKCYKISITVDDNLFRILLDLGESYYHLQNEEKGLFYCEQVIKLAHKSDKSLEIIDSKVLQQALSIVGTAYVFKSHCATGQDYLKKSLKIAEKLKDSESIESLTYIISIVNTSVGVSKSCSQSPPPELLKGKFHELFETAKKHELNKDYKLALSCYKTCEFFERNINYALGKSFYVNFKMDIARMNFLLHRYDTALSLYQENCKEEEMNGQEEALCHHMMSKIHVLRSELASAENCARKSVECFDKVFDLQRTNEEYQIAIVDKYIQYYELLTAILVCTNQNIEALETVDRYRARALKTQLIMNYHMDQDIQEKPIQYSDIQSLVSKSQYTIVQYFACRRQLIKDLCIFLVPCENKEKLIRHQPNFTFEDMEKQIERAFSGMKVRLMDCEDRSLNTDAETNDWKTQREDDPSEYPFEVKVLRTLPLQEQQPPETGNESSFNSALEILYSKLIHNVISDIKTDEIVFIPDGPLFKVPFAALRDSETGLYLSETKRSRIAPSISTLKILSDRPADFESKSNALIVGDPSVGKVMFNGKETEFPPLLFSFAEAVTVSRVLGGQTFLREKATKAAVLKKLREGVSVVHIAAHGDGKKGTIALAPSPNASKIPEEDDYMLTMADVQKANVRAKLVVLSCCHSGRGEIKAEGVIGMCRAFLASGARAVVASLWAIDDDATLEFMKVFYRNLKEKKSASLSLQLAMKFMRRTEQYHEPTYWAPFFLMGDDVVIDVN